MKIEKNFYNTEGIKPLPKVKSSVGLLWRVGFGFLAYLLNHSPSHHYITISIVSLAFKLTGLLLLNLTWPKLVTHDTLQDTIANLDFYLPNQISIEEE